MLGPFNTDYNNFKTFISKTNVCIQFNYNHIVIFTLIVIMYYVTTNQ